MDPRTGKRIRMGRIFGGDRGAAIIVAYSHGVLLGPLPGMRGIDEMRSTVHSLSAADGIMIAPGLVTPLEDAFVGRDRPALVIHLDWSNFSRRILPYQQGMQASLATIEQVVSSGADAVMTYLLLGNDDPAREAEEIARNAQVARECERYGVVHIIEPRHSLERRKPDLKLDLDIMRLYARISGEIGADIVKCVWPGSVEKMASIVQSAIAPVLVSGGERQDRFQSAVDLAEGAMRAGCSGLVFGRNIYQDPDPGHALALLREVVRARATVPVGRG